MKREEFNSVLFEEAYEQLLAQQEAFDFARCQRRDGSYYGTGGQCRKGSPAPPKEKAAKKEGTYQPRAAKGSTGAKADLDFDSTGRHFQPESYDAQIEAVKGRTWMSPEQIDSNVKALELQKRQAVQNKKFLEDLEKNVPKGTKLEAYEGDIVMTARTSSGATVQSQFSPKGGYNFEVNGTLNAGTVKDRRAQLEVASTVRGQYDALVRSLPTGHIVETSAYTDDGKGLGREKAYRRVGFSKPSKLGGKMFAVKQANGTMVPGKAGNDGTARWMNQKNNADGLWFSEKSERAREVEEVKVFYEIIFGEPLQREEK